MCIPSTGIASLSQVRSASISLLEPVVTENQLWLRQGRLPSSAKLCWRKANQTLPYSLYNRRMLGLNQGSTRKTSRNTRRGARRRRGVVRTRPLQDQVLTANQTATVHQRMHLRQSSRQNLAQRRSLSEDVTARAYPL